MNEELRSAHERIAELEALIAGRALHPGRALMRSALAILFAATLGALLPLGPSGRTVVRGAAPLPEPAAPGTLVLADGAAPVLVRSEQGTDYALVRAWRQDLRDAPLFIVAFDRKDWHRAWSTNGFASDGEDRGELSARAGVVSLVIGSVHFYVNLTSGILDFREREPHLRKAERDVGDAPPEWSDVLPAPGTAASKAIAINERLYDFYSTATGARRLQERVVMDRRVVFDVDVPGLGYGTRLHSIVADSAEVILSANDSLFVLDAKTGALKKRFDSF